MAGDRDTVHALLQVGADVDVPQIDGTTALHWAAQRDDLDIADLLAIYNGIRFATALMRAAYSADLELVRLLLDYGAAPDVRSFGGSVEPLMPIDYAIGVGTFRPNNAIVMMEEAVELMTRLMQERGIVHTTSECTLRAFTCGDVDPMAATPSEVERLRAIQIGHRAEGIVGGLAVEEAETSEPKGGLQ